MRYPIVSLLACPHDGAGLLPVSFEEKWEVASGSDSRPVRLPEPGALTPILTESERSSRIGVALAPVSSRSHPVSRVHEFRIWSGLLVAAESGRWFPVRDGLAYLLPDSQRDWDADLTFFNRWRWRLPKPAAQLLEESAARFRQPFRPAASVCRDHGNWLESLRHLGTGTPPPADAFALLAGLPESRAAVTTAGIGASPVLLAPPDNWAGIEVTADLPYAIVASPESLPFQDARFWSIVLQGGPPDPGPWMMQASRLLTPTGRLILAEVAPRQWDLAGIRTSALESGLSEPRMQVLDPEPVPAGTRPESRPPAARIFALRKGPPHAEPPTWRTPADPGQFVEFDAAFFDRHPGMTREQARRVAEAIQESVRPRTVLDAGCGLGHLVSELWDLGIVATGIDGSAYAVEQVPRPVRTRCHVTRITEPLGGHYDLAVSIGVLAYLGPDEAVLAIDRLCEAAPAILFQADPDQPTGGMRTLWPLRVWLEEFASRGFFVDARFDAIDAGDQAVLLRRATPTQTDLVHLGVLFVRRQRELAQTRRQYTAEIAQLHASLAAAEKDLERLSQKQARFDPLADQMDEVTSTLQAVRAKLQDVEADASRSRGLHGDLLALSAQVHSIQHSLIWTTLKRIASLFGIFGLKR